MNETANQADSKRLPPGSHGIPAAVVARNQRERLIAAMVEVCAERSYADASVAAVVKVAGVSSVTFYEQFADKRDCMLAAHRQLLGRLLEAVDEAVEETARRSADSARASIRTMLSLLAADPPSARLLTVEVLAAGPEGVKRHDALVSSIAERLGVDWVLAAGVLALVGKLAMAGEVARLPKLEDELAVQGRGRRLGFGGMAGLLATQI